MRSSEIKAAHRDFRFLSSIVFIFWFVNALGSYLTIFLLKQGYGPDQVGIIYAYTSIVSILSTVFCGVIADKIKSNRKIFIFCFFISAVFWAMIPVSSKVTPAPMVFILSICLLHFFFKSPTYSLLDAFVVQRADQARLDFGRLRMWGSISFAITSLLLSVILPKTGVEITFYLSSIAVIPLLVIMLKVKDTGKYTGHKSFRSMGIGRLFRNYNFITYLIYLLFFQMSMNAFGSFLPYLINTVGGDPAQIGILGGCVAMLEIPMLLLARRIKRKFPMSVILSGAVIFFIIEAFLFSRADSFPQIIIIHTLYGIGSGLMIGMTSYIYSFVPGDLISTAYTMCGSVCGIAAIIGNLAGGMLVTALGIHTLYFILGLVMLFTLCYFVTTLAAGTRIFGRALP